jgi:hypothetical protein
MNSQAAKARAAAGEAVQSAARARQDLARFEAEGASAQRDFMHKCAGLRDEVVERIKEIELRDQELQLRKHTSPAPAMAQSGRNAADGGPLQWNADALRTLVAELASALRVQLPASAWDGTFDGAAWIGVLRRTAAARRAQAAARVRDRAVKSATRIVSRVIRAVGARASQTE